MELEGFSTWKNERHTYTDIGTSGVGSCVDLISNLILQLTSSSFLFFVENSGIEFFSYCKNKFRFFREEALVKIFFTLSFLSL